VSTVIRTAQRQIACSEELQALLAASIMERRRQEVQQSQRVAGVTSVEMLRRELVSA
jgi:hypothetical protein